LRTLGVGISAGSMQVYSTPDSLRPVLDYYSPHYYTIAQYTNLTSNNIYAESIFKYLGYVKYGNGTFENGARAITDYFRERGLDASGVRIVDGSGLSRLNRTTADFLCRYLMLLSREQFHEKFLNSLSVVGQNGTAKNLLPTLPKGIEVRVKTGSMDGVKSYAGYITTRGGETLAFAIIANDYTCTGKEAADKLNRILLKIATSY
jgi:D-alanyl-D-alanine carboxypeptidase/D-alanyl-D-alanine-endopeptidase (penicillin-binding protein 4)